MTPTPILDQQRARGVETNGIGKVTTAHLNLTRAVKDVDDDVTARRIAKRMSRVPEKPPRPRSYRQLAKIAYAGRER